MKKHEISISTDPTLEDDTHEQIHRSAEQKKRKKRWMGYLGEVEEGETGGAVAGGGEVMCRERQTAGTQRIPLDLYGKMGARGQDGPLPGIPLRSPKPRAPPTGSPAPRQAVCL
jgi:hypothetical protein